MPTEKDNNEAWRMISKFVSVPGIPQPIIYAINRGGVWTIDENRKFALFGGEFPANMFWDHLARNPNTGHVVGVNAGRGVFAIDPHQTQFRKLYGVSEGPLRHPYSIEFIPRLKGFVISDASGLYLLDDEDALKPLPLVDFSQTGTPFAVFDLPAFDALLVNADVERAPTLIVRYDDGHAIVSATLRRFDFVRNITVNADSSVKVKSQFDERTIHLTRSPRQPGVQGETFVIDEHRREIGRTGITATSLGKTFVNDLKSGLSISTSGGLTPVALPFDTSHEPIESLVELSGFKVVLIFTRSSAYALLEDGAVSEIRRVREFGVSPLTASTIHFIPERNEAVFLGQNSWSLLIDTRISGEHACD